MNNTVKLAFTAALLSIFTSACGSDSADNGIEGAPALQGTPLDLQGFHQQGLSQQGLSQQGSPFKAFVFASFVKPEGAMSNVTLNGTVFSGIDAAGTPISGSGFVGATMTAVRGDESATNIRIEEILPSSDPDISLYRLSWNDGTAWVNPCGESNGTQILAIPLNGRWDYSSGTPTGGDFIDDPNMFTFSCTTGIIGKCALFGYKPWRTVEECNGSSCQTLSLRPFHQACTRMMRADYCGRGTGHTVDGNIINLYDRFGVQTDATTAMPLEAEWTPEGAKCVKHLRWTSGGQAVIDAAQADINANCSEIDDWGAKSICGTQYSTFTTTWGFSTPLAERALLRNDSEPPPNSNDGNDDDDTTH